MRFFLFLKTCFKNGNILFPFFLFLIPVAYGFDCSSLDTGLQESCAYLNDFNESLIAELIYQDSFIPSHELIRDYNDVSITTKPTNTQSVSKTYLKDAWLEIITVQPSVKYGGDLLVGNSFNIKSEYDYSISLPPTYTNSKKSSGDTCRIEYSVNSKDVKYSLLSDSRILSNDKSTYLSISSEKELVAKLDLYLKVQKKYYEWDRYCCARRDGRCVSRCYDCDYDKTKYDTESISLTDSIVIIPYDSKEKPSVTIIDEYLGTYKGLLVDSETNYKLTAGNSSLTKQTISYSAEFLHPPYYLLQLTAKNTSFSKTTNLIRNENNLFFSDISECKLSSSDLFSIDESPCEENHTAPQYIKAEPQPLKKSWRFLAGLILFILAIYIMYIIVKKTWGKYFFLSLFMIPFAFAEGECGLTNLGQCVSDAFFDTLVTWVNAPLDPILTGINYLLVEPVILSPFKGIWSIILYLLGFFYLIMLAFAGFKFLTSGTNILAREQAKEWLKNTFLVFIFTSASFYMYELIVDLGSTVTTAFVSLVPETFFRLTIDNITNVSLQFVFFLVYLLVLLITLVSLALRYILVAIGVIFAPLALFCYFIPPLKSYGSMYLNVVGIAVFSPVIHALIIIACSKLLTVGYFDQFKILVMIGCFTLVNVVQIMAILHIINKSGLSDMGSSTVAAGKYIAALFA